MFGTPVFNIKTQRISEPERKFIQGVNDSFNLNSATANALTAQKKFSTLEEVDKANQMMGKFLCYVSASSPVGYFFEDLYRGLEEGRIAPDDPNRGKLFSALQDSTFSSIKWNHPFFVAQQEKARKAFIKSDSYGFNKSLAAFTEEPTAEIIAKYIRKLDVPEAAKSIILSYYDENKQVYDRQARLMSRLVMEDFIAQWAKGDMRFSQPLGASEDDIRSACNLFFSGFESACNRGKESHNLAHESADLLANRLIAAEQSARREFLEQQEKDAAVQAEKQRVAELARQKEAEESAVREACRAAMEQEAGRIRQETFMAKEQPYAPKGQATDQLALLNRQKSHNPQIERLLDSVGVTCQLLDRRHNGIEALGDLLFSPANITAAAKTLELDNALGSRQVIAKNNGTVTQLQALYSQEPAVEKAVDTLLEHGSSILFLATLTRDPARCKQYVEELMRNERALAAAESKKGGKLDKPESLFHATQKLIRTRDSLASEIRLALRGEAVAPAVPAASIRPDMTRTAVELPERWRTAMGEMFAFRISADEKNAFIFNRDYPEMGFHVPIAGTDEAYGAFLSRMVKLRTDCENQRLNDALEDEFIREKGFERVTVDHKATLRHREYGIQFTLDAPSQRVKTLLADKARTQFEIRLLEQHKLLDRAREVGIIITGDGYPVSKAPITLKHSAIPTCKIESAYLTEANYANVESMIKKVAYYQAASRSVKPTAWEPEAGQTMLVFDANVLDKLTANRGNTRETWIDFIEATSKLPDAKIIIPAVVAEWELQGKIPLFNAAGKLTGHDVIDKRYQDHSHKLSHIGETVSQLLRGASRARRDIHSGKIHFEPGFNENIIIWDTEGDKAIYKQIREKEVIRATEKVRGTDEGEKAIERVIKELPKAPVIIVSDDMKYFEHHPLINTPQRLPVGLASTGSYVQGEIKAREEKLRGELDEQIEISADRIETDIDNYLKKINNYIPGQHSIWMKSMRGKSKNPQEPMGENIYEVIARGVAEMNRAPTPADNGIPENGCHAGGNDVHAESWADPGMRPLIFNRHRLRDMADDGLGSGCRL